MLKNKDFSCFQTLRCYIHYAKNVKMPTIVGILIVGILTFKSMTNLVHG